MADDGDTPSSQTLAPNVDQYQTSIEATIESTAHGRTESSSNNINNKAETSALGADSEKSLEFSSELMERGSKAVKEQDFSEAADCFSRALEIRVAHYGELSLECVNAYYKYGCALLYKAQEEADPLGAVPKKEGETQQASDKDGPDKKAINGESSAASVSSNTEQDGSLHHGEGAMGDASGGKEQEENDEESDVEDEEDEDESDLDLAWKMLDLARAIVEKHSGNTMENVDILSALAEVALEREDIETSLSDYLKALSILEGLVEPDSRLIAELNFRICLCLENGSKAEEAIPYCQKAISVCKSRVVRLMNEVKSSSGSTTTPAASESDQAIQHSSNESQSEDSVADKEAEIETLAGLSSELEKKLEDLQQLVSNPTSILSDILGMISAKARGTEKCDSLVVMSSSRIDTSNSSGDFDSPAVSTAHTNGAAGVTHLGVVGRGVKRVLMNRSTSESAPMKKTALGPSLDKGDGGSS